MKRLLLPVVCLSLAASLSACGKKAENEAASASPAEAPASNATATNAMSNMEMAAAKMAKGSGTVTAVDPSAGTITLDHGPIPEAGWPAMTMAFKAGPAVTGAVKTGDKVDFDLKLQGGTGEVTAVSKR